MREKLDGFRGIDSSYLDISIDEYLNIDLLIKEYFKSSPVLDNKNSNRKDKIKRLYDL